MIHNYAEIIDLRGEWPWQTGASCYPSQGSFFSWIQFRFLLLPYFLLGRLLIQLWDSYLPGPSILGAGLSGKHNPGLFLGAMTDSPAKLSFATFTSVNESSKDMFLEA